MGCSYKNPRHVYDVLRPLLAFSKYFGLTAFSIVGEPPYVQVKVTGVEYVALLMNFVANLYCVYINVTNSRLSRWTGYAVMNLGLGFLFPLGAIIMIVLAIDNFMRRDATCQIIGELFKVDRYLQRIGHQLDHRRQYVTLVRILFVVLMLIATGTVFALGMSTISEFSIRNHLINSFSYALTGIQFMIVNFHFVAAARLVSFRLDAIKCSLKKHLDTGSWYIEQKQRWGRRVDPVDVVSELAEDFAALVDVVDRVNRIYSNQIIALITGVGMFSIFVIYATSFSYYVGRSRETRLTLILLTACVVYIIMIGLIFFTGVDVENTSNDIVGLLHEAIQRVVDSSTKRKLIWFSQQILFRRPKLRCIFYDYDWKTIYNMFGFVVTYLIILLQFDKFSDDASKKNFLTS
uniref:Gustatory receptor n=1 Tax=Anopheles coluzzii TaxID=1518534 RepID=A0A6E8V9I3_ANOCL